MNLLLLEPDELDGAVAELRGRRARHAAEVLRAAPGDRLRVGVVRGPVGSAVVENATHDRLRLAVELAAEVEPAPSVDLVFAMPRPKALGRALETAAQLGVARIDLVNAWRVDKSYFHAHVVDPRWIGERVRRGCEQGATTWVPEVAIHPVLMRFVDHALPARLEGRAGLVCHPRGAEPIERAARPGPCVLAIGPEGGWIDREVESLCALGFRAVSLGPRVLASQVAIAAALAQLDLIARQHRATPGPG